MSIYFKSVDYDLWQIVIDGPFGENNFVNENAMNILSAD